MVARGRERRHFHHGRAAARLLFGLAVVTLAMALRAEEPSKRTADDAKKSAAQPDPNAPAPRVMPKSDQPPGAATPGVESPGSETLPGRIVLTAERYQELLKRIELLESQLKPARPTAPSACRLSGRVEGDVVHLQAVFEFRTERDRALVALACPQANPTAATLDGKLPLLLPVDDGFVVQVDKADAHTLSVDMDVPVSARGNERGFVLDLPHAAITTLALDVPESVKDARLSTDLIKDRPGGRLLLARPGEAHWGRVDAGALGPVRHLELSWKGQATTPAGPPLLAAEGRVNVRIDPAATVVDAELTLRTLRGQAREWRLVVPLDALVEVLEQPAGAQATVDAVDPRAPALRVVRLSEPSAEPFKVMVHAGHKRGDGVVRVGPFAVEGAFRQRGSILVSAPPDLRLRYQPVGAVGQREATAEEQRRDPRPRDAFTYWSMPQSEKPASPAAPLLEIGAEPIKGVVEMTRVAHTLRLTERGWQVTTELDAKPIPSVDRLEIQLPAGFQLDDRLAAKHPGLVQSVDVNAERVATLVLTPRSESFHLTLEGTLPAPAADAQHAVLDLPVPRGTLDRGGQVTVVLPETLALVPLRANDVDAGDHQHTWSFEQMPARVEIAWRAYEPEFPVDSIADVMVEGRQIRVRQRLRLQFAKTPPATVTLRLPAALGNLVRLVEGGRSQREAVFSEPTSSWTWTIALAGPVGKEHVLTLDYALRLPETAGSASLAVPFVVAEPSTRNEVKARVWTDSGLRAELMTGPWEELPTEVVADRPSLPALVARCPRAEAPLPLRVWEEPTAGATTVVDRALVRVQISEGGFQEYRTSLLLSELTTRQLTVEWPVAVSSLGLKVFVDGKLLTRWEAVDDSGQRAANGRLARLTLAPLLAGKPSVLDFVYQASPGRLAGNQLWQSTLIVPVLRGDLGQAPVRWQVSLPAGWVPVSFMGSLAAEQHWGWRGWLLAPRPALTSGDLERWFFGPETATAVDDHDWAAAGVSFTGWRNGLEPLRLYHAPQQAWLLACSLTLLAAGLALYFLPLPRGLFWGAMMLLVVALTVVGLLWPGMLSALIYGSEPGALVLIAIIGWQWLLHQRYRRQLVFMPGFARLKATSSVTRGSSILRNRTEPSTVDNPPGAASAEA